jgi:two-component system, cell cycle sensor histidine kinase and response regulator CckA
MKRNRPSIRKNVEKKQPTPEAELQLVLKNMFNAFVVWESVFDDNGKYVSFRFDFFNESFAKRSNVRLEEVRGKDVFDIWPETERSWVEVYSKVVTTGISCVFGMYHAPTKGWYHCNAYRPTDSPSRICVILEDITPHKQFDEKMQESEERYRSLVNNMQDAVYQCDLTGKVTFTTPAAARLLGYSSVEELIGMNIRDDFYYYPDERDALIALLKKQGKVTRYEVTLRDKDGKPVTILTNSQYYYDKNGVLAGVEGVYHDITERKHAEEALVKSEAVLRSIFEASSAGIALLVDRSLTKVNRSLCRMTGYSEDELLGKSTRHLYFSDNEFDQTMATYNEMHRDGLGKLETRLKCKDGSEMNVMICLSPVNPNDAKAGVIAILIDITSLKKTELALKKSEALLRSIFDASPAGISLLVNRTFLKVNTSMRRITGYSEDELIGRSSRILYYNDDDFIRAGKAYTDMERNGLGMVETRMVRKNGSEMNAMICLSPINPTNTVALLLDTTDLKQTELALKESEVKYRTLVDNMQDAVYRCDMNGNVLFTTPSSARMLGCPSAAAMIGMNIMSDFCYYPEDAERLINVLHKNGKLTNFEVTLRRQDNDKPIVVLTNSQYFHDKNGTIMGVEGVYNDITDRKRAEVALEKSEAVLKSLFNATPIGLGILIDNVFVKINNSFSRIMGYPEHELLGQSQHLFYTDQYEFDRVNRELFQQMEKDGLGMTETRLKRKDCSIIDAIVCLSPFAHKDLSAGMTFAILDITERKRMESEKVHLEEMLLHSQKLESIGRLAGGIAHDFNNMLTAIIGNSELVMDQLDPTGELYTFMTTIMNAGDSAANLTRQLLAFSRKQIIKPKTINLNDLIEHVHKMILTLISENIKLYLIPSAKLKTIKADPGQIEQIIINLAANARDAMVDGGKLLIETSNVFLDENYSRTHLDVTPGDYAMLAVTDTGIGMSKETMAHIFEPFFTTKDLGHGTGLGLATVYGIVKQSGGAIEVYSEVGKGTTFKLYFPVSLEGDNALHEPLKKKILPTGSETILIAEDNEQVLAYSRNVLQRLGYHVLIAPSGEDALKVAKNYKEPIDLFMTDVILPGMNGREAAERISAIRPGIKTLYNSGYTAEVIDKQGILEEGFSFISKPFTSQELSQKVRNILDENGK